MEVVKRIDVGKWKLVGVSKKGKVFLGYWKYEDDEDPTWSPLESVLASPRFSAKDKTKLRLSVGLV